LSVKSGKGANPIWQNKGHIKALSEYLEDCGYGKFINYHSIIVFSERCELKEMEKASDDVYITKRDGLEACINKIIKTNKPCITKDIRDKIIEALTQLSRPGDEIKQQHVADVKEVSNGKCPLCQSGFTEKKNSHNGVVFLSCKSFPNCKYSKSINQN